MEKSLKGWHPIAKIGKIRGIVIGVWCASDEHGRMKAMMLDPGGVWHDLYEIDHSEPAALSRAIATAEAVYKALRVAADGWRVEPP